MLKNVLVTGATGFVGQHLIECLKLDGNNIRIISRKPVPGLETIICDFLEDDIPENAFDDIDTVFHLAGYAHDLRDPSKVEIFYRKMNVNVTIDLLTLSMKYNIKRFIFVSSVKAGGVPIEGECTSEENQSKSEGIYGGTKREAELKILEAGRKSGMHVSILRPTLIYGPKAKGNLKLMMNGIKKGWFPPLPETGNRRSMVHVDDVVRALLLLASDQQSNGETFIVTDGRTYSSRDIYKIMSSTLGKRIPRWTVPLFLFNVIALINPHLRYRIDKLLGDEYYSSNKIQSIGFKAKKTLKDMHETNF
jgi:nucleoside-diphosphate-sugar epimerase